MKALVDTDAWLVVWWRILQYMVCT